ncbi:SUKH-3 domain-containing protein [Pseudoalteromonas viridis]|uniref:SUKH-3 domain-containing protein n=1 Tax=Pseudoalteromonas viridis TaxID=339617 RepID=A0ABX7V8K4_9GAMM|nr:SUKH-3 domain-containing protein [Pseudoalteromonas viridis]QTL34998.1 SUKH-3 domain-containing protein [Pseudoalteromonas viridis]
MDTEEYITKLFVDAGWHEGRKIEGKNQASNSSSAAHKNAVAVLAEFGGLDVGEVGSGRDLSASDISFRTEAFDFGNEFHNYWQNLDMSLFAFASAHHDHMLLLVDDENNFYIFTDPDEQLYKVGSFKETMKRVLLGINYGAALEKA